MKNWNIVKRMVGTMLLVALGLLAAACGGTGSPASSSSSASGAAASSAAASSASSTSSAGGHKILVAYFSASGNTKAVAEVAAKTLGADLYELNPAQPYTEADMNYRDKSSRVFKEHEDANRHTALANPTPEKFADYDVVLIGAPMWWHEAAWPINDFLTKNDFTGKIVVPFVTSSSDPLGDSGKKKEALAGTGKWQQGMRFSGGAAKSDVETWAKGLKF